MSPDAPKREMVTIQKACELAQVSRRTMYTWVKEGKVAYVRTAGGPVGRVRIFRDSLFRDGHA